MRHCHGSAGTSLRYPNFGTATRRQENHEQGQTQNNFHFFGILLVAPFGCQAQNRGKTSSPNGCLERVFQSRIISEKSVAANVKERNDARPAVSASLLCERHLFFPRSAFCPCLMEPLPWPNRRLPLLRILTRGTELRKRLPLHRLLPGFCSPPLPLTYRLRGRIWR